MTVSPEFPTPARVAFAGAFAGATIDIVTLDVVSGAKVVHLKGIPPGPDDSWLEVSPQPLPSPWVLLQPVFIESTALPIVAEGGQEGAMIFFWPRTNDTQGAG